MHVLTIRRALPYILWGIGIAVLNSVAGWSLGSVVMGVLAAVTLLVTRHVILRLPVDVVSPQEGAAQEAAVPVSLHRLNAAFLCLMFVLLALGLVPGGLAAIFSAGLAAAPAWLFWMPMLAACVFILPLAVGTVRRGTPWAARRRALLPHWELVATGIVIGFLWTVADPGLRFRPWGVALPFIALSLGLLLGMAVMAWQVARRNLPQG